MFGVSRIPDLFMVLAHDITIIDITVQDNTAKSAKPCSLKWFGEEITNHIISGTILDFDMPTVDAVCNKKISDIHVASPLTAGPTSMLFQEHCALIILVDDRWL